MNPSVKLPDLLRKYRYEAGVTQADLATALDTHQPVISNYERGRLSPSRDELLAMGKILNLTEIQTNELLIAAKYNPIAQPTVGISNANSLSDMIESGVISIGNEPISFYNSSGSNPYRELNIQIQDLKDAIAGLSEHLDKTGAPNSAKDNGQSESILSQVEDLKSAITELQATSKGITAPVALPSKQQLEVKLIPTTSFERLEEYRSDENKWLAWFGIFVGAMLGVVINLITGGQATTSTWIVSGTFGVGAILTGLSARSFAQRARKLQDTILNNNS